MKDELNITIRIAQELPIPLTIKRSEEEAIRKAERRVNQLWKMLHDRFPNRSNAELLALTSLQFARIGVEAETSISEADKALTEIEMALDVALDSVIGM